MTKTLIDRFEEKYIVDPNSGCWLWIACTLKGGYGLFANGKDEIAAGKPRLVLSHRFSYELHKGPIPKGLELDHLCRTRCCVNPSHLEAVTKSVNVSRGRSPKIIRDFAIAWQASKTLCPRGHSYSGPNLYISNNRHGTKRHCRACQKINRVARMARS